jgi:hypothetical protein
LDWQNFALVWMEDTLSIFCNGFVKTPILRMGPDLWDICMTIAKRFTWRNIFPICDVCYSPYTLVGVHVFHCRCKDISPTETKLKIILQILVQTYNTKLHHPPFSSFGDGTYGRTNTSTATSPLCVDFPNYEQKNARSITLSSLPWRWRQCVPPKTRYVSSRFHGVITQTTSLLCAPFLIYVQKLMKHYYYHLFYNEDGGSVFLQNVGTHLPHFTVS